MKKTHRFSELFKDKINIYIQYQDCNVQTHWHEHYELTLCTGGEAYSVINNERSLFKKGDMLFLTPSDFHSLEVISPLRLITLTFNLSHLTYSSLLESLYSINCKLLQLNEKEFNDISFFLNEIDCESKQANSHSTQYIKNIFSCILIKIFRHNDINALSLYPNNIKKIMYFVNTHFKEQITLKDVSEYTEISYSNIGKYIKKYLGVTFLEYLNDIRLIYSTRLLINSSESISDIASFSGFVTATYFSKIFKKKYGITPKEYREQTQAICQ